MTQYLNLVRPWRSEGESRELLRNRLFSLHSAPRVSPVDPSRRGEFLQLRFADWANVVALTAERSVVMIEQYRHGLGQVTLELPGGIVEPGESPESACARELLEETGYAGEPAVAIGRVSANPALQNNWLSTCLVRSAKLRSPPRPDEHEEIAVRLVPLAEVPGLIRAGIIHHSLVVAAFHHLSLAEEARG